MTLEHSHKVLQLMKRTARCTKELDCREDHLFDLLTEKLGLSQKKINLANQYFGEGIAVFDNKIYQITWREKTGFIYNKETFELERTWNYNTEGWGLTQDGENIIMSDGTSTIYFLNPDTLQEVRRISVKSDRNPVRNLNELEYIDGNIFANVWMTDSIVAIDPQSGNVKATIVLRGLKPRPQGREIDVLNGIAFDKVERKLYVTGKLWPKLYQIELVPK